MRDYGKISTRIWHSRKFRGLSDADAQLLYLYLLTCPHVNSAGCFVLRDGYATDDLNWDRERYQRAMEALSKALLVVYDRGEKVVLIRNFFVFEPISNRNHAKGTAKLILRLPDCEVKSMILMEFSEQPYCSNIPEVDRAIEGVSKGYRTPEPEPEPEPDIPLSLRDIPPKQKSTPKRGTRLNSDWKPDETFIQAAIEIGMTESEAQNEADRFRDYWIAKSGKDATKLDWLATWRNWCRRAVESRAQNRSRTVSQSQRIADAVRNAGLEG